MPTKQLLGRTKRARRNLALKLVLERRFKPEVRSYFNNIVNNFLAVYVATGQTITPESFTSDTQSLLKKQYLRTSKAFSNEMRLSQEKAYGQWLVKQEEDDNQFATLIDAALLTFINQVTPQRAELIVNTNIEDINTSVREATNQLVRDNRAISDESVGLLAATILRRKFQGRNTTITMTETQFMAESTKQIESGIISSGGRININDIVTSIGFGAVLGTKSWASILDGDTRTGQFNHVQADGQRVGMSEAFVVSGQRLMFPGHSGLGASIGNTVNCRCSALYQIDGVTIAVVSGPGAP